VQLVLQVIKENRVVQEQLAVVLQAQLDQLVQLAQMVQPVSKERQVQLV
jgi:hypothetical protein